MTVLERKIKEVEETGTQGGTSVFQEEVVDFIDSTRAIFRVFKRLFEFV